MKISQLVSQSSVVLKDKWRYAYDILSKYVHKTKTQLIAYDDMFISEDIVVLFWQDVQRLLLGEPVDYILGRKHFWKSDFIINKSVLIPRDDSSAVIENALSLADHPKRICDLGSGSGCLIISLLLEFQDATGDAIDSSDDALEMTYQNAILNGVSSRISCIKSDMFENIHSRYDLIVSNPPYISSDEFLSLEKSVSEYEPRMALTDNGDGLSFYRIIANDGIRFLNVGGILICEVGYNQSDQIIEIFTQSGWKFLQSKQDIQGIIRSVSFAPCS